MSVFECYLTVWYILSLVIGIAFRQSCPGAFQAIGAFSVAQVNLPVGFLIWVMTIPMLVEGRLWCAWPDSPVRQGHWRHAVRQLVGQAVFHGACWVCIFIRHVFGALAAGGSTR